jgi:hypothetical protein
MMQLFGIALGICSALWLGPPERLDEITLTDGHVLVGQLLVEEPGHMVFREVRLGGRIIAVHRLEAHSVARVRRNIEPEVIGDPPERTTQNDHIAEMDRIIRQWKDNDLRAAAANLLRVVDGIPPAELTPLDAHCRAQLNRTLDTFAAELQVGLAMSQAESGLFRLAYLTRFNLQAVHDRLEVELVALLNAPAICPRHSADAPICGRKDVLATWMPHPGRYDGRGVCATHFGHHVMLALGVSRELIRVSHALRRDAALIRDQTTRHEALRELFKVIDRRQVQ